MIKSLNYGECPYCGQALTLNHRCLRKISIDTEAFQEHLTKEQEKRDTQRREHQRNINPVHIARRIDELEKRITKLEQN